MNNNEIKEMVDKAVNIDKRIKTDKKKLDGIKAELQAEALKQMENKNLKYVEYFGSVGSCYCGYKEKLEIDNLPRLKEIIGAVADGKITVEESIKVTLDDKLRKAIISLYKGNYKEYNIIDVLFGTELEEKKINLALKKLKGDYFKDKNLLNSLGVVGDLEEELDAIKEHKNFELIEKFFDIVNIDIEAFKKCVSVEDTLSIGIESFEK